MTETTEAQRHKATDVAFVRFRVPDIAAARQFTDRFGLLPVEQTEDRLYMKGTRSTPFLYAASRGEPRFDGVGFHFGSREALAAFAGEFGAPVETLDGPASGQCVKLHDPDGFSVEAVVFDDADAGHVLVAPAVEPANDADTKTRWNRDKRHEPGPSEVYRLGHVVLNVSNFRASEAWYKQRFGFITSDEIVKEDGNAIGAFLRCDRGEEFTDHHTLFLLQLPDVGFNHAAFEVRNFDSLMAGHDHLTGHGYQHRWGIGRHILGSQIFDYWRDPWGHVLEHWTDGDLMNAGWGSRKTPISQLRAVQWGHVAPHGPAK